MISPALRTRLEFAAKAFLVASFLGSLAAGVVRLRQRAFADPEQHVDLGRWAVAERPPWCTLDDVRELRTATRLTGWSTSIHDAAGGAIVWRSLDLAPTTVRVAGIRRCFPNSFEAVVELRPPVAAVAVGSGAQTRWVEVDAEGRALSPPRASRPARPLTRDGPPVPLRVVRGAGSPVPALGERFGAPVVAAADLASSLDTYGTLADRALLRQLDEIDVTNFGGRVRREASEVVLRRAADVATGRTPPRADVEWGRATPRDETDREPSFGAKAGRAAQALRMFPDLAGVRTVKVAFADLVVVPTGGSPLVQGK